MARITPQTARLLADEMIKAGRAPVSQRDSLIRTLLARSEATGDAAPETAIGAALMAAQPRTVTPAAPAPMQPGVPFVAPKPVVQELPVAPRAAQQQAAQQQAARMLATPPQAAPPQVQELPVAAAPQRAAPRRESNYQQELNNTLNAIRATEDDISQAEANGQKPDLMAQIRLAALKQTANKLGSLMQAEQSPEAEIPEELRAAQEGLQARLAKREERLQQAKGRSVSDALIAGGGALAQGRAGESLVEALSRGLQAGTQQYDRSRQQFEEGTESIAEARDKAMIDRYTMRERATANARQRALEIMGMSDKAQEGAIREAQLPLEIRGKQAGTALAEFNLQDAPVEAASVRRLRAAQEEYYRNRPDRSDAGGKVDVEKRMAGQALQALADDYDAAAAVYNASLRENKMMDSMVPAEVKSAFLAAQAKLKSRSSSYARTYGSSPFMQNERPRATSKTTATGASKGGAGWSATKF
jgi:hypothetical protein